MKKTFLPAEWHKQSLIQLTWPHPDTDWAYMLEEVEACFLHLAHEIAARQPLLIVTPEPAAVKNLLQQHAVSDEQICFAQCDTNDTWARDHAFITLLKADGTPLLCDFCFNGWGRKFASNYDNQINSALFREGIVKGEYKDCRNFVLEGGSIESDGKGTLLTTAECLLSPNRNDTQKQAEIENYLKEQLNVQRVLWLNHGYLAGDDTDSHVDTLARLCPDDTIVYVQCTDETDEHYKALKAMEEELKAFRTSDGKPYRLLPLPMADAVYDDDRLRIPATYANFLIMNEAVLYPTYRQSQKDACVKEVLAAAFPHREIVGIDCTALIKQHGSLHCVTMQYPEGVI